MSSGCLSVCREEGEDSGATLGPLPVSVCVCVGQRGLRIEGKIR